MLEEPYPVKISKIRRCTSQSRFERSEAVGGPLVCAKLLLSKNGGPRGPRCTAPLDFTPVRQSNIWNDSRFFYGDPFAAAFSYNLSESGGRVHGRDVQATCGPRSLSLFRKSGSPLSSRRARGERGTETRGRKARRAYPPLSSAPNPTFPRPAFPGSK